jgi:iron complex outermembrane receptor protein
VDVNGVGKSYWNDANTLKQDPYELVNARLGFETDHFEVYLWAKNIFDAEYEAIAFEFPGFPPLAQAGDPQIFGITLTGRF